MRAPYRIPVAEHVKIRILSNPDFSVAEFSLLSLCFLNPQFHAYISASQARVSPSTSYTPSRHKRSYEEDEDMDLHPSKQKEQHMGNSCC